MRKIRNFHRKIRRENKIHLKNVTYTCLYCGTFNYTKDNCRACGSPYGWNIPLKKEPQTFVKFTTLNKFEEILCRFKLLG